MNWLLLTFYLRHIWGRVEGGGGVVNLRLCKLVLACLLVCGTASPPCLHSRHSFVGHGARLIGWLSGVPGLTAMLDCIHTAPLSIGMDSSCIIQLYFSRLTLVFSLLLSAVQYHRELQYLLAVYWKNEFCYY